MILKPAISNKSPAYSGYISKILDYRDLGFFVIDIAFLV